MYMGVDTLSLIRSKNTVFFFQLNTRGIHLKIGSFDPAFFRGLRIIEGLDGVK